MINKMACMADYDKDCEGKEPDSCTCVRCCMKDKSKRPENKTGKIVGHIPYVACPKCGKFICNVQKTGPGKKDFCYYCSWCKKQVLKEEVIVKENPVRQL